MILAVFQLEDQREFGVTQPTRCSHDGLENGLKLRRRIADGSKDFAGGLLPLQRLGKLALQPGRFFASAMPAERFRGVAALRFLVAWRAVCWRLAIPRFSPKKV